jgi:hypothetical protein
VDRLKPHLGQTPLQPAISPPVAGLLGQLQGRLLA